MAQSRPAARPTRPTALREALRAAAADRGGGGGGDGESPLGSDVSLAASDSPSEEDYDDLASPPAEAMVLRQRRKPQTQLRHEVQLQKQQQEEQTPLGSHAQSPAALATGTTSTLPPSAGGGHNLSATVIFEEKSSSPDTSLSSAATAVSSAESADDSGGGVAGTGAGGRARSAPGKDFYDPIGTKGHQQRSFVFSIDDPKLAQILRADLEQMREELEDRRLQQQQQQAEGGGGGGGAEESNAAQAYAAAKTGTLGAQHRGTTATDGRQKRKQRRPFRDFVFTRGFSAFDRQNAAAANSPFHGFYTLFWMSVFVFMLKIGADNWRKTGSPLGHNEIMANMFHHDVIVLLASDGVLCALTGVSWVIQRIVFDGRLMDWDGAGWIVQNVWQSLYVAGFIWWTQHREWPWSHTVFFVLHGLVMLMKQHAYAFYNGYLSTIYKRRKVLQARLEQLQSTELACRTDGSQADGSAAGDVPTAAADADNDSTARLSAQEPAAATASSSNPPNSPNPPNPEMLDKIVAALQSGQPLDYNQARVFERILHWEIDGLTEELRGKATQPSRAYPHNLTFLNHYEYIVLPTVVYELEYPRSESINWRYAAEKLVAIFGIIFVMIMVSQAFMYPVVMRTVAMKEAGVPLWERFKAFPWILSDLIFPFILEYLLSWYLIWETILNFLAELTYFADRSFYSAWWNSVTWDDFARDWNRPVHMFLLRHVYHSSISAMKVNKHTATMITFFLSACVHELVMWCIFKKLRGYLLFLQMCQLPLVRLSRTKWMRNRQTLGNIIFWAGIFFGPSGLCSLYLIL